MVLTSFSQNYTGTIDTIAQDGFHKIILTPEVRSAAHENFNLLRVKDAQKNEVPYVLMYNVNKTFSRFEPIEIASKNVIKDSVTSITIENKTGKIQEYITLQIANTNIRKNYTIYGSNNAIDWFGLSVNQRLTDLNSRNKTTVEKTISFPLNTYKFLQINFNDKNSLPINILDVGVYKSRFFAQSPIEVTVFNQKTVSIKDKKVTQLKFSAENTNKVHIISFKIGTEFFLRNAKVIVKKTRKVKKRVETYNQVVAQFQLNSKAENTFVLYNLNEKEFSIEIDDQDNPPLDIKQIQLFQKPIYLVTNLKKDDRYELVIDTALEKPSYDLGNFINDKTATIDEVFVTNFSKSEESKEALKETPFWETSLFMWICIVLGGIIVVYFSFGLLKDINNQEKK